MATVTTCTRRLTFCAGHRVMGHENKCAHMHGHNYVAVIECSAPSLDKIGRVIDFSVIKQKVGKWIDDHWDHSFIYHEHDEPTRAALRTFYQIAELTPRTFAMVNNPTAENMAEFLLSIATELLAPCGVDVESVTLHETENCHATARAVV